MHIIVHVFTQIFILIHTLLHYTNRTTPLTCFTLIPSLQLTKQLDQKSSDKKGMSVIATSEELLFIIEESELHLVSDETTWFVDSRVSFHLIPDRKCFSSYRARDQSWVRIGNEGSCRIVDIGDVWLTTSTGCKMILKDVRHILEVRLSLISAEQLDDEGYTGSIREGVMKFSKGSLLEP